MLKGGAQFGSFDGGYPALSGYELDYANYSWTVYVVSGPDYRGRLRPRVVFGGTRPYE
jgi:hypothetical protein